jgi:transmembrane 9 superfamily protein 2/4
MNLFVWGRGASGAVPFTTMLLVVIIWFIISVPLSVAGSWIGFKQAAIEPPVRTNQIPRQIPPVGGYLRPLPSMALAGLLPFGAIFVELYFIMHSIWFSKVYYMFGFLFICFGLMIITSAAVTVLMIYFLLCAENYHWQWRSFFIAGASAAYVFASCLVYWIKDVSWTSWTSGVVYLGYSALLSSMVFILTGMFHHILMIDNLQTNVDFRYDWLLCNMDVYSQDLPVDQGGLSGGFSLSMQTSERVSVVTTCCMFLV